ncbi:MAG: phosphatase PAP2 family protein [Ignavibacteriae bacterium]|nr:phosphatase PAP2 family protein [Ignavibacteriota bacterium]
MKAHLARLDILDSVIVVFFLILTAGLIAGAASIPLWGLYTAVNIAVIIAVFAAARLVEKRHAGWKLAHGYARMLLIPLAFKEVYFIGPALHPHDYDYLLIAADRWLFGTDPTHVLAALAHPLLTEILQIAYGTFYFLPVVLAADLHRSGRFDASRNVIFITILGFFLSYFGYVGLPAIGPRFTLHDFERTEAELPGLFVTSYLREMTNTGESIPPGTPDPEKVVQRDCFPSGHTQMTLLVIILAFRTRARSRWPLAVTGSLLIFATVYLRYHYVVDLLAGAVFVFLTLWLGAWLARLREGRSF